MNYNYYEICIGPGPYITNTDFWMCVRGVRQPLLEEAERFYKKDVQKFGGNVMAVNLITEQEANAEYDLSNESDWPIFGA